MKFVFNELALYERLSSDENFSEVVIELEGLYNIIRSYRHDVYFNRLYLPFDSGNTTLFSIINNRGKNIDVKHKLILLIAKFSNYLFEDRIDCDLYLRFEGEKIENCSIYDFINYNIFDISNDFLLSLSNTNFSKNPIFVECVCNYNTCIHIEIKNYYTEDGLKKLFIDSRNPFSSWSELASAVQEDFPGVKILDQIYNNLSRLAFSHAKANSIYGLCRALNEMATAEHIDSFNELYRKYCTGANALFSDSSHSEKNDFANALTFEVNGERQLCSFHGKIRSGAWRLHMNQKPSFKYHPVIVYIGEKLTKR